MTTLPVKTVLDTIVDLLTEAYAGPPDPNITWFVDNQPGAGLLPLLDTVSAAEASASADGSGQPGSTIAANVEHLRWSLANANGAMRGQEYNPNWGESWNLTEANQASWDALRKSLRAEFESLREALQQQQELPGVYLPGTLALIPHAAFHLGVIRQMLERVREQK
jgi:hypothetical protein